MFTNGTQSGEVSLSTIESLTVLSKGNGRGVMPWDLSDPVVSAHVRDLIKMTLDCYIQQILICLGIPGNILCCVVFFKQGLSDKINLLLFSLAVADLISLVTQFLLKLSCFIQIWDKLEATNWETVVLTEITGINLWSGFVSGTLIVIMSVDRCLSVAMPLKSARILTFRPMLAAIVMTYLVLLACFLPRLLAFTVKWRMDPSTNRTVAYRAVTDWFTLDPRIPTDIAIVLTLIVKPVFVITVTICCIITITKLLQSARQRMDMQGSVERDRRGGSGGGGGGGGVDHRITKMLLFLCIVYVVLILPELGSAVTHFFVSGYFLYQRYHNSFVVVRTVIFTAFCLNSTANVFAYLMLSSRFRGTLQELCHCFCKRKSASIVRRRADTDFTKDTDCVSD